MRAREFLKESKTTLSNMYRGSYPDRDEAFWTYVSNDDLTRPMEVNTMSPTQLKMTLLSQYRAEHMDEILELLEPEQEQILQAYQENPRLSEQIIVLADGRIIDGNHRALAAALNNSPIRYVDVSDIEELDEMALSAYQTIGDFEKKGQFNPVDRKLVQHPVNYTKAVKFFEKTPYDFRLFFNNRPGLRNYREQGVKSVEQIQQIFGKDSEQILQNHEGAITIVFIGNYGTDQVMMTPWIMAHRLGHAIQATARNERVPYGQAPSDPWAKAEAYFFRFINNTLEEYYNKAGGGYSASQVKWNLTPEYNALFNAIGTQRSSRENKINRPYEFFYEIFAQYLKDGAITLNPLPRSLDYGRKAWGRPTKFMRIKQDYDDELSRQQASEEVASQLTYLFNSVLKQAVGKVYVM
jgi:hypothetical protein